MYERVKVTLDMEVAEMPTKEQLIKNPVKEAFDKKLADLDTKINHLRANQKNLHTKRKEVIDGGKVNGGNMTYRETLTTKINALREVNAKKRSLQTQMKEHSEQLDLLEAEKRTLLKTMHPDYRSAEHVTAAIQSMEYKQKTSSFKSANEENKLIKEIEVLKASMPKATRFS